MDGDLPDLPRGTPLAAISAQHIRGWNAAARANRSAGKIQPLPPYKGVDPNSTIVRVRNISGADLERFAAVKIGDPIIESGENEKEFQAFIGFDCTKPTGSTGTLAVLVDPLADGKIGRAVILGAVQVKIYVANSTEAGYEFAVMRSGETSLGMATSGYRVLWKEAGYGGSPKWAVVVIDAAPRTSFATPTQSGIVSSTTDSGGGSQMFGGPKAICYGSFYVNSLDEVDPANPSASSTPFLKFSTSDGYSQEADIDFVVGSTSLVKLQFDGYSGQPGINLVGTGSPRFLVNGVPGIGTTFLGATFVGGILTAYTGTEFAANGDWASSAPTTIESALNRIATVIKNGTGAGTGP